jgi:uncharacterized membrane protein
MFGLSDETLRAAVNVLRMLLEGAGAFWIAIGFIYAFIDLILSHIRRQTTSFTQVRITFSRYLSLALEFQLASDILSTAVAPTWEEIGKLAATAVIRTALNYFLSRDLREYVEKQEREEAHLTRVPPVMGEAHA